MNVEQLGICTYFWFVLEKWYLGTHGKDYLCSFHNEHVGKMGWPFYTSRKAIKNTRPKISTCNYLKEIKIVLIRGLNKSPSNFWSWKTIMFENHFFLKWKYIKAIHVKLVNYAVFIFLIPQIHGTDKFWIKLLNWNTWFTPQK